MLAPKATCTPPTASAKRRRDMTTSIATAAAPAATTSATLRRLSKKQSNGKAAAAAAPTPSPKIWRTRAQLETLTFAPMTTAHKMSSVGNAFPSDDLYSSFDQSIAEDDPVLLIRSITEDPELQLVYPQHNEVARSSPLSIPEATFEVNEDDGQVEAEAEGNSDSEELLYSATMAEENIIPMNLFATGDAHVPANDCGMTWNQKGNQWVSLAYRYVFPASAFDIPSSTRVIKQTQPQQQPGGLHGSAAFSPFRRNAQSVVAPNKPQPSFSFPAPQASIMMGSDSLTPAFTKEHISSEAEAREACQKLLQLIDDEALMLPLMRSSTESLRSAAVAETPKANDHSSTANPACSIANKTLRSLHSEWSSLPSSPPPPIFHDGCNRPIPELRLSPPLTVKQGASAKKLFAAAAANQPGLTESPLTKRLRMSSSASSSSLI